LGGQSNKAAAMKLVVYGRHRNLGRGLLRPPCWSLMPDASVILRFAGFGMACTCSTSAAARCSASRKTGGIFAGLLTVLWFIIYLTAEWVVMRAVRLHAVQQRPPPAACRLGAAPALEIRPPCHLVMAVR
jgi:hypothetical protein